MFIGHFALGFAAKRVTPGTSLGTLMLAATFLDVVWPVLLLMGIEHVMIEPHSNPFLTLIFVHYPASHSLLMCVLWVALFAGVYGARTGHLWGALVTGALVASHWVLDFITHVPDLPILPRGPKVGLGLWNDPQLTMAVEVVMLAAGVVVYVAATRSRNLAGTLAFWVYVAVLVVLYVANATGSPPSDVRTLAITALVGAAILVAWAYWIDRLREQRAPIKPKASAPAIPPRA